MIATPLFVWCTVDSLVFFFVFTRGSTESLLVVCLTMLPVMMKTRYCKSNRCRLKSLDAT